jgi:hypothetical protein
MWGETGWTAAKAQACGTTTACRRLRWPLFATPVPALRERVHARLKPASCWLSLKPGPVNVPNCCAVVALCDRAAIQAATTVEHIAALQVCPGNSSGIAR